MNMNVLHHFSHVLYKLYCTSPSSKTATSGPHTTIDHYTDDEEKVASRKLIQEKKAKVDEEEDYFGLLPHELVLYIMEFTSPWELCALFGVNHELRSLATDDKFWKRNVEPKLQFHRQDIGKYLSVSEDGMSVSFHKNQEDLWNTARSYCGFDSGVHYWELSVDNLREGPNTWRMVIGVQPEHSQCVDQTRVVSWGYIASGKKVCNNAQFGSSYNKPFDKGDTVGVLADMDEKKLHFFLNRKPQGLAFTNLVGKVYPCISMYLSELQVSIKLDAQHILSRLLGYKLGKKSRV
jgi:hypothetical protein